MPNETHRAPLRYNISDFFSSLLGPSSSYSRVTKLVPGRRYIRMGGATEFPGSSTVEHSAVNRRVASSNLARGAKILLYQAITELGVEHSALDRMLGHAK